MATHKTLLGNRSRIVLLAIWLGSTSLLTLGLTRPVLQIAVNIEGVLQDVLDRQPVLGLLLQMKGIQVSEVATKLPPGGSSSVSRQSIVSSVYKLYHLKAYAAGTLILLFSVIVPIVKQAALLLVILLPAGRSSKLSAAIQAIHKWAMLDVFVLCTVVIALSSATAWNARLLEGFFWFLGYFFTAGILGIALTRRAAPAVTPPEKTSEPLRWAILRQFLGVTALGILVGFLPFYSKTGDEPSDAPVKLRPDEVWRLLGIREQDGIRVGAIESGRNGVKVESISFAPNDHVDVDFRDIELRIAATGKLTYGIIFLQIAGLDILDRKTTRHVHATGVHADEPGDGFLPRLEAAVASVRSGGPLKTADLSCGRLTFDKIEYGVESADAIVKRASIEDLSITDATTETLGELSVSRAGIDGRGTGRGLKLTKVDRAWADRILALLVTPTGATQPAASQPSSGSLPSPAMTGRRIPFDHFEVAEMNFVVNNPFDGKPAAVNATHVFLDVQRQADGRLAGLHGTAKVNVSTGSLGPDVGEFVHAMGNPKLDESLASSVELKLTFDPSQNVELSQASVDAPGLGVLTGTATTRGLCEWLILQMVHEAHPPGLVTISSFDCAGRDDGLLNFAFSRRYAGRDQLCAKIKLIPAAFAPLKDQHRLSEEIDRFLVSPRAVQISAQSRKQMGVRQFYEALTQKFGQLNPWRTVSLELSFTEQPPK